MFKITSIIINGLVILQGSNFFFCIKKSSESKKLKKDSGAQNLVSTLKVLAKVCTTEFCFSWPY